MEDQDIFYRGNGKRWKRIISIEDGKLSVTNRKLALLAYSTPESKRTRGKGGTHEISANEYREIMDCAHVQPSCVLNNRKYSFRPQW